MTPAPSSVLRLDEVLDLRAADALVSGLRERRGRDLLLDASGVRRLGGLCLQALLAASEAWAADDQAFCIIDPTPAFTESLERFGASLPLFAPET